MCGCWKDVWCLVQEKIEANSSIVSSSFCCIDIVVDNCAICRNHIMDLCKCDRSFCVRAAR